MGNLHQVHTRHHQSVSLTSMVEMGVTPPHPPPFLFVPPCPRPAGANLPSFVGPQKVLTLHKPRQPRQAEHLQDHANRHVEIKHPFDIITVSVETYLVLYYIYIYFFKSCFDHVYLKHRFKKNIFAV